MLGQAVHLLCKYTAKGRSRLHMLIPLMIRVSSNIGLTPPAGSNQQGYLLNQKTAASATQCRSNPVSGRHLPKTGVFQMSAGDYWLFRSENAQNWSPETDGQFAKARHWRALVRVSGTVSPSAGLPGRGGRIRTSIRRVRNQTLSPGRV
jgi:hypothetical protein